MNLTDKILIGVIGGLITGILIPILNYFIPRLLNKWFTTIRLTERQEGEYTVYNLIVHNSSLVTLKNVYSHVTINNEKNDIIANSRIKIFCSDSKVDSGMLSWSKNLDNKNYPHIDINQGESPDINFIRFHSRNPDNVLEIASERGFFDESMENKARTVLMANRDYTFNIKLTGDNLWPKNKSFHFRFAKKLVTK